MSEEPVEPQARAGRTTGVELDLAREQLWCGGKPVALRPKSWLVLRRLATKPGELVSHDELTDFAWPGTAVTPGTLTNVINELRRALGDDASAPRFIQTVFRRGYRWIASPASAAMPLDEAEPQPARNGQFVGRVPELRTLGDLWSGAVSGRRTTVFLGGDAGIGKTTLVTEFRRTMEAGGGIVAEGTAVETHGALEPFLPFFAAIDDLLSRERAWLLPLLARFAPSWLAQMPWIANAAELGELPHADAPTSMLREGAALWEAIAADRPLLLVLEDLHVADRASVALVGLLAERSSPARLLVLATYRSAQAIATEHPVADLARKLVHGRRATALPLSPLSKAEVRAWLAHHFSSDELASALADTMERLSEGNPLFLSALAAHAVERGMVCRENGAWQMMSTAETLLRELPDDLRGIVDSQLQTLGAELTEVLEVAAAAGLRFVAQDVGGGMDRPAEVADALCHRLAKSRHFLRCLGEVVRPDGTRSGEYEFVHSLYRQACYERLAPALRQLVHERIALGMEKAYGSQRSSVAHQIATQFEAADDVHRSVEYLFLAVASAKRRHERSEAHTRLEEAHARLGSRPHSRERDLQEYEMQAVRVNMASIDIERYGDVMLEAAQEAERLAVRIQEPRLIFLAGMGLATGQAVLGMVDQAALTGNKLLAMTENALPTFRVHARVAASYGLTLRGELERSAELLGEAVTLEPEPGVPKMLHQPSWCRVLYAYSLSLLGRFREADMWTQQAVELVDASGIVSSRALVEAMAAEMYAVRGDLTRAAEHNGRAEARQMQFLGEPMNRTRALASWLAYSIDGAAELDSMEAVPFQRWTAWPALLATAQRRSGRFEKCLVTIDTTLREYAQSGAGLVLAELHRERGEIAMAQSALTGDAAAMQQAETQYREALRVARHQRAKLFELRATNALARVLAATNRVAEAIAGLRAITESFRDEEGTDVDDARRLLTVLGR